MVDHISNSPPSPGEPEMILDIEFEDGVFSVSMRNIGSRAALDVRTTIDPPVRGLGGRQPLAELPLFRGVPFFAPGKQIRFLLDSSTQYFSRGEPTRLAAKLTWSDDKGKKFETVIHHDLEIYRSLAYRVR